MDQIIKFDISRCSCLLLQYFITQTSQFMHLEEDSHINQLVGSIMGAELYQEQPESAPPIIYIEEQNVQGKFIPSLLLKQQIGKLTDNDGNTLLHHMCSFNSPYLPLYIDSLEQNHEQFNQLNKHGMSPLDIAAMFCSRQIFDKLKAKGAEKSINGTDYWCIRGANMDCWSGKVPVDKKQLIHWAAYNDLPEVLKQFHAQGADLNLPDNNGTTPIDTALINKSYKSFEFLLSLGFDLTNLSKLKDVDSPSMQRMYKKQKLLKKHAEIDPFIPLGIFLVLEMALNQSYFYLPLTVPIFYILVRCIKFEPLANLENQRNFSFYSKLLKKQISYGYSHIFYLFFLVYFFCINLFVVSFAQVEGYFDATVYLLIMGVELVLGVGILLQLYGIFSNLTNVQMFSSHECQYLYKPISVVSSSKIAVHTYKNPYDQGYKENLKEYLKLC